MKEIKPSFQIGDSVKLLLPDLFGEILGKVTGYTKVYQTVFPDGEFDMSGLAYAESEFDCFAVPYECDGQTLKITNRNGKVTTAKLFRMAYDVQTAKMCLRTSLIMKA